MMYKTIVTCGVCGKELSERGFNRHLSIHYDPMSRNCDMWYNHISKKTVAFVSVNYVMKNFIMKKI